MSIFKFRVLLEDPSEETIYRDIAIKSTQNFDDFHEIIVAAFGFDNSQMASFYVCDEEWNKGQEISLFDLNMESDQTKILVMEQTIINTQVTCVGAHLIYSYDFLNMKNFFVELIEVQVKEDDKGFYSKVVYSQGEVPVRKEEGAELSDEELANKLLSEAGFGEEGEDENESDIFDGFDDFDNYQ